MFVQSVNILNKSNHFTKFADILGIISVLNFTKIALHATLKYIYKTLSKIIQIFCILLFLNINLKRISPYIVTKFHLNNVERQRLFRITFVYIIHLPMC